MNDIEIYLMLLDSITSSNMFQGLANALIIAILLWGISRITKITLRLDFSRESPTKDAVRDAYYHGYNEAMNFAKELMITKEDDE